MISPLDEYPLHQIPQPIAWPGTSDRNFYDRSYFPQRPRPIRRDFPDQWYRSLPGTRRQGRLRADPPR